MGMTEILKLIGGVGLFLYGMQLMGDSLKQVAGAGLERILEKLTNSRIKGVTLGTVVTGIIQSSAATSIMLIGFINAGIMRLAQTIPVIMAANIGSTVTGQILRLGDIGETNIILRMLKPSSFAPLLVAGAIVVIMFCRKSRPRSVAGIFMGLGILFIGMSNMEAAFEPLRKSPEFQELFTLFSNPLLGILVGAVLTAIIQSSSASVGILQAISSTGAITWSMAIPIILGQNIGACVTVWLGAIGKKKEAQRVSFIYTIFNILGAILIGAVLYAVQALIGLPFWNSIISRGGIANFHSLFNIITTIILLPFCNQLQLLSEKVMSGKSEQLPVQQLAVLEDLLIKTPAVALTQCRSVLLDMGSAAEENFRLVRSLLDKYDDKIMKKLDDNEVFLDKAETQMNEYLVKLTSRQLADDETRLATEIMRNVGEIERIGDYCVNIADVAEFNHNNGLSFSAACRREMQHMLDAVSAILRLTLEAFETGDLVVAARVEPLEEVIDLLKETLTTHHVERLQAGLCSVQSGISFIEIVTALERISDHCSNIAIHTIKNGGDQRDNFDEHEHLRMMHEGVTEEYKALFRYYESLYYDTINEADKTPVTTP